MTQRYKEGEKIYFKGDAILASFSSAQCLTPCPHGETALVGSVSCEDCKYYGGRCAYAVATGGSGLYGTADMEQNIYCKSGTIMNDDK